MVDDSPTRLELPDDLKLLAGRVLLDRHQREQVLRLGGRQIDPEGPARHV
jgi:hypothetical protein